MSQPAKTTKPAKPAYDSRYEAVIGKDYNLVCPNGHRYLSPNPSAWVGKSCDTNNGQSISKTCREPLELISGAKS